MRDDPMCGRSLQVSGGANASRGAANTHHDQIGAALSGEFDHAVRWLTIFNSDFRREIDASRETVSRLFSDFKRKEIVQVKGSARIVRNEAGLEMIAGG